MNREIHINQNVINFGIPLALFGTLILLMKSSFLNGNDTLNFAITADLLLTVPVVYFLLIRKSEIPNTTAVPVMIIGLLVGSFFIPQESNNVIIHLKKENELVGLYGMKKRFNLLGLHIDEPKDFKKQIEKALQQRI